MKDLLAIRDQIDQVDNEITALYLKRMQLTSEVAEYKIQTWKKVFEKETGKTFVPCIWQFFKEWSPGTV